jgi:acyl carrier protein
VDQRLATTLTERFLAALETLCAGDALPSPPGELTRRPWPATIISEPAHRPASKPGEEITLGGEIAAIAGMVLGQRIAADDDLFQAGARSLDLIRLAAEIEWKYGTALEAVDLFDCATPANLAALIETRLSTAHLRGSDLEQY